MKESEKEDFLVHESVSDVVWILDELRLRQYALLFQKIPSQQALKELLPAMGKRIEKNSSVMDSQNKKSFDRKKIAVK